MWVAYLCIDITGATYCKRLALNARPHVIGSRGILRVSSGAEAPFARRIATPLFKQGLLGALPCARVNRRDDAASAGRCFASDGYNNLCIKSPIVIAPLQRASQWCRARRLRSKRRDESRSYGLGRSRPSGGSTRLLHQMLWCPWQLTELLARTHACSNSLGMCVSRCNPITSGSCTSITITPKRDHALLRCITCGLCVRFLLAKLLVSFP